MKWITTSTGRWLWLFLACVALWFCVSTWLLFARAHAEDCTNVTLSSYTVDGDYGFNPPDSHVRLNAPAYLVFSTLNGGADIKGNFECLPFTGNIKLTESDQETPNTIAGYTRADWISGHDYVTGDIVYNDGNIYAACLDFTNSTAAPTTTEATCITDAQWRREASNAIPYPFTQTSQNDYVLEADDVITAVLNYVPPDEPAPTTGIITERDKQLISLSLASFIGWLTIKQFRFRTHD